VPVFYAFYRCRVPAAKLVTCALIITLGILLCVQPSVAKDSGRILKDRERNSISLELEFSRQREDALQRIMYFLEKQPNAYATGFFVGPRLVLTAYHVVSGNLDISKRMALGFGRDDQLEVKVYTNGCPARVLGSDKEADLALLEVCAGSERAIALSFQSTVVKDERLLLIARPHGEKVIGYGTFFGSYAFNGIEYWSARIAGRDGFSGSPLYNEQGELVGVFSGYDWSQKLAVISPASRAQKLMANLASSVTP